MKNYENSKFKIFENQKKNQYSFVNQKLKHIFKKKILGKLIIPNIKNYKILKSNVKNTYLNLNINDENMLNIYELSKLIKINKKAFFQSLNSFKGLPHRYEIFLRRKKLYIYKRL